MTFHNQRESKELTMTEPTVNVPLLRKAVEWAEAEAAKPWELCEWEQGAYRILPEEFESEFRHDPAMKAPECGTCFCIAGYVAEQVAGPLLSPHLSDEVATRALGLTEEQAMGLFAGYNTITDVRRIAESIAGERL